MLTQCPGCATVFRVTSAILRAAHGQVRCGSCNTQFDAIEELFEGDESEHAQDPEHAAHGDGHDIEPQPAHEEIILEGTRIEISGVYPSINAPQADDNAVHARTVIEEFNIDTEEWENPFEPNQAAAQAEENGAMEHDDRDADDLDETAVEDIEEALTATSLADAMASLDIDEVKPARTIALDEPTPEPGDQVAMPPAEPTSQRSPLVSSLTHNLMQHTRFEDIAPFAMAKPPRRWPWVIASMLLSIALLAQALHHSRAELARHPGFGPQLTKLYAALGQPLSPQWQLQAYSIKQWGIVSDPLQPGTLRVRASVTNGADFAQPYPLLELSLEDRFGGKVGVRAFTPQDYLEHAAQATRLLAAGEAANIDLAIVDPGADAVGFQFDTCLQQQGALQCTHDLPPPML